MNRAEINVNEQTNIERLDRLGQWLAVLLAVPSVGAGCARPLEHSRMEDEDDEGDEDAAGGMPRPIPQPYHHF